LSQYSSGEIPLCRFIAGKGPATVFSRAKRFEDGRDRGALNFGVVRHARTLRGVGLKRLRRDDAGTVGGDVKRLAASLVVASQDEGIGDGAAESAAVAGVRAYRQRMGELATMTPLDVCFDRIELAKLIEEASDKATRKRRKKMRRKAHRRVADNVYPKLVDTAGGELLIADQPLIFHLDGVTVESMSDFVKSYRSSLPRNRQISFDRFTLRDVAIKVVGVGSGGTRCYVLLFTDDDNPLPLQVKEANNSVLALYVPKRARVVVRNSKRVVIGQHLMQPASDIFLGYSTSPQRRDFYVRRLRDMKLSVTIRGDEKLMTRYAEFRGIALARAHAKRAPPPRSPVTSATATVSTGPLGVRARLRGADRSGPPGVRQGDRHGSCSGDHRGALATLNDRR
jgi:uncharacterized protein (DUF2252 family)